MRIYFLSFHISIFPTHHPHQKIKSLMCSCPAYGALRHRWKEHMAVRKVSRCSVSVSTLFNPRWRLHLYSVTKEIFFCWSASSWDQPNSAECGDSLRTLEALLTQVVEEQWGYRLCLLERDLLPGGGQSDVHLCLHTYSLWEATVKNPDCHHFFILAYTSDIVLAIQKSQMLVCVLSAYYFADNNAVFVLESAVQVDLHIVSVYVYTYI